MSRDNSQKFSSKLSFNLNSILDSKYSSYDQRNAQKLPQSNMIDQRHKKIHKNKKKELDFAEVSKKNTKKEQKKKGNFLDQLAMQQHQNLENFFNENQEEIKCQIELPPDDELDYAYNNNQYKFKACGNKMIPRYMDSTCLGQRLNDLKQMLNDSVFGYKIGESCNINEIEIDCDSYEQCCVCNVESLKLNNIIRRKNYTKLPAQLIEYLKENDDRDGYICLFYGCKNKDCEVLLCPYCYVFGVQFGGQQKSDTQALFEAILKKSKDK